MSILLQIVQYLREDLDGAAIVLQFFSFILELNKQKSQLKNFK